MRPASRAVVIAVVALAAAATVVAVRTVRRGFSARDEPSRLEALVARAMRRLAVPSGVRTRANPVRLTPAVLAEAKAHFADHCASCHGNDGKGRTNIGQSLYPKAPDMTLEDTQSQTDGELFAIIENGVRLTGMPAWGNGSPESAQATWALVHFIRHLPKLTEHEVEAMRAMNPRTREEWESEAEDAKFLAGQ
jgi:mono/diheme cytochrome c family protein